MSTSRPAFPGEHCPALQRHNSSRVSLRVYNAHEWYKKRNYLNTSPCVSKPISNLRNKKNKKNRHIYTSYATLSGGLPENFRGIYHESLTCNCIFLCFRGMLSRLYHEKGLHNYFIPGHRRYSGQIRKLGVIQMNCTRSMGRFGCFFYGMIQKLDLILFAPIGT